MVSLSQKSLAQRGKSSNKYLVRRGKLMQDSLAHGEKIVAKDIIFCDKF